MFDRVSNKIECDKVIINDFDAAYDATSYLLNKGRKKIALLSTINDLNIGKLRRDGYREALKDNVNYKNKELVIKINSKTEYHLAITSLFDNHKDLDGIFATDNVSAVTALKIANSRGLAVPKDIAVIGFSDDKISRLSFPSLTTVSQSALEIGKSAVNMLIARLNNDGKPDFKTKVIQTDLVVREST